jgi:hypothetical protein
LVNFQYIVLEVDEVVFGLSRDCIVALFTSENIRVRRSVKQYPFPAFCQAANAEKIWQRVSELSFPMPIGSGVGPGVDAARAQCGNDKIPVTIIYLFPSVT